MIDQFKLIYYYYYEFYYYYGCARVCKGVRGYAQCGRVCIGVHWCAQVCVKVYGCLRVCAWDEFSEYLLENWVPTSADFNTYPIRILDTHIWRFFLSIKKICSFGILRCHGGDLVEFQMCHQSPWYIIVTTPFYSGLKWRQKFFFLWSQF